MGEAVSGAALAGALAPVILQVRPVAAGAEISYVKIAKCKLTADATISVAGNALLTSLKADGKVAFDAHVVIADAQGDTVATMIVNWHVRQKEPNCE